MHTRSIHRQSPRSVYHLGQRPRRGSLLIMVVVLLVLMALLGTAFLVTARNDRISSKTYDRNIQIELLVDGVKNMAIASIMNVNQAGASGAPSNNFLNSTNQTYIDWTTNTTNIAPQARTFGVGPTGGLPVASPATPVDTTWLAARIPGLFGDLYGPIGTLPTNGQPYTYVPRGVIASQGAMTAGTKTLYAHILNDNALFSTTTSWNAITIANLTFGPGGASTPVFNTTPMWPAISAPIGPTGLFEDPINLWTTNARQCVIPSYTTINGTNIPTMTVIDTSATGANSAKIYNNFTAASASGNGIADSMYFRLPVGTLDGVTYYAAVRIIDNNSAINLNTAFCSSANFDGAGNVDVTSNGYCIPDNCYAPGYLPSHIGLAELTYDWLNGTARSSHAAPLSDAPAQMGYEAYLLSQQRQAGALRADGIINSTTTLVPETAGPIQRSDLLYKNQAEANWFGLGRRVDQPGYVSSASGGPGVAYRPFSFNDQLSLAYKFDLASSAGIYSTAEQCLARSTLNPNATWSGGATPTLSNFQTTVQAPFSSVPWDPSQTSNWGLAYGEQNVTVVNRRPYFVASNYVSGAMPNHIGPYNGTYLGNIPVTGTSALFNYDPTGAVSPTPTLNLVWNGLVGHYFTGTNPNYPVTPKCSLNTAPVMANDLSPAPATPSLWLGFFNAMYDFLTMPGTNMTLGTNAYQNADVTYMFKNPIRNSSSHLTFSASQMVLLRSLLAAVNAKALRGAQFSYDSTGAPTYETFAPRRMTSFNAMTAANAETPVTLYAYGTKAQPFISEIYASTETTAPKFAISLTVPTMNTNNPFSGQTNQGGYVGIVLYNPYRVPMTLKNWQVMYINRSSSPMIPYLAGTIPTITIPAQGYALLEDSLTNYKPWLNYPTATANMPTNYVAAKVTNLTKVFGNEMVLMRPVTLPPVPGSTVDQPLNVTPAAGQISIATLTSFAPVDSFDFSNFSPTILQGYNATSPATTTGLVGALHYLRPSYGWVPPTAANQAAAENAYVQVKIDGVTTSSVNPNGSGVYPGYTSPKLVNLQQMNSIWKCVYPGQWVQSSQNATYASPSTTSFVQNGAGTANVNSGIQGANKVGMNEEGAAISLWATPNTQPTTSSIWVEYDAWQKTTNAMGLGASAGAAKAKLSIFQGAGSYTNANAAAIDTVTTTPYADVSYTNAYPGIQLCDNNNPGPNKIDPTVATPPTSGFPFGAFPRVADVLNVPFFGGYIVVQNGNLIEINSVTRDCAKCAAKAPTATAPMQSGTYDLVEAIGRFCPIGTTAEGWATAGYGSVPNETNPALPAQAAVLDPYLWASHICDFFTTVGNVTDAATPNVSANDYYTSKPAPAQPQMGAPQGAGINGLLNINTCNWRALAAVPWVPTATATATPTSASPYTANTIIGLTTNPTIARAIVNYRNTYGPFKSIFELNNVTGNMAFQSIWGDSKAAVGTPHYGSAGDFSATPVAIGNAANPPYNYDGMSNDFKGRYTAITRVSNLITTRSDTFTVYILVQGWTGVGTTAAQPVVQRRLAFVIDRSSFGTNSPVSITPIPTN